MLQEVVMQLTVSKYSRVSIGLHESCKPAQVDLSFEWVRWVLEVYYAREAKNPTTA